MKNEKITTVMKAFDRMAFMGMQNIGDIAETSVKAIPAAAAAAACITMVHATGTGGGGNGNAAGQAIDALLSVLYLITNVIGVIFVVVGFVRIVIAHAQEDGPGQQKAAMFIGTGVALILLRVVMSSMNPASWISTP